MTFAILHFINTFSEKLSVGEGVTLKGLPQEVGVARVRDGGYFYKHEWKRSELLGNFFSVKSLWPFLVLQKGLTEYAILEGGVQLKRESDGTVFAVPLQEGVLPTPELPCDAVSNEKEKVIPTQGGSLDIAPEDLEAVIAAMCEATQPEEDSVCPMASNVAESVLKRAIFGLDKYGVTTDRNDLTIGQWLTHAQEEAMDLSVYIEKIQKWFKNNQNTAWDARVVDVSDDVKLEVVARHILTSHPTVIAGETNLELHQVFAILAEHYYEVHTEEFGKNGKT